MTIPLNPYVAGNPVGDSPAFVGRADVLREVLRILRRPQDNAIVLYGQRRIGKTSILQHLAAWLSRRGPYRPVYFDLQDKAAWPLGRVLQELARTVAQALDQPEPDLDPDPETAFRQEWLPLVLGNLPEGCALVLLFDEFDVLADPQAEQAAAAFFPYLRGLLASDPRRLQFVFVVGRNVDDLDNIALSLFKGTLARRVSLLNHEDTADLVRLSEAKGTLRWPDEAVERVWQLTCGHTFLTQQLCSHVWERAHDEEPNDPPTVIPEAVDAAIPDALGASRNMMEWLWDGLPPPERVVASALAEAGPGSISQEMLERVLHESGVRVVIRELQNAPQLLQDWDLFEPTDGGYRFRVELLRRWIAVHKPLRRVQEELDRIEPVAENYYQAALGLYHSGQLDGAIDDLERAIALNPNHVRANQLLADILLSHGQPGEAQQLLERLYEYQPAAARHRLVQALLAQAQAAESEDEQLALYERVLQLDRVQREAKARQQRIWQRRGDIALERDDLEAVLEAYRMAGLTEKVAEVEREMRRRELAARLHDLKSLEQERRYQDALVLARELVDEYPGMRDWTSDLERLERKTHLADLYRRGLGALQSGDRPKAQTLLAKVVALEPRYEEATRYLHLAVAGVDVVDLQAQLEAEEKARLQREQELQQLQTQLEAERKTHWYWPSSARNVLDYLTSGWGTILQPLRASLGTFGETVKRRAGGWLVGTVGRRSLPRLDPILVKYRAGDWLVGGLTWLPILLLTLALGAGARPCGEPALSPVIHLWTSLGLVLACVLTGWLGYRDDKVVVNVATIAAFVIAAGVVSSTMFDIVVGVAPGAVVGMAPGVAVGLALVIAGGAASGVADAVAGDTATTAAAAVATAMTLGVVGVVAFVVERALALGVVGVVVGVVVGGMVVGVVVGVVAGVARSAKAALGMSLLVHVFLIWLCFLRGR